uniref:Uncharacterized protein n=1 Tax=Ciona savignyi TaxID=51511 RepID=H2YUG8_CIOSA
MDDENFLNPSLVTAYVTNTPPQNRTPQVSSPFQSPVDANHRLFSISSTTASPIRPACIVSSTPFIGRHSSTSDGLLSQADAELPAFNFVNTPSCQPTPVKKPFNATFDVPPSNTALSAPTTQNNPNLTFDVIVAQPLASDTFTASVPSVAAAINTTYNADATQSTVINNTFNAGLRQATAINPPKSNTNNQTFDIAKNNTTFNAEATKVLNTTVDIEPSKSTAVNKTFNAEKTVS